MARRALSALRLALVSGTPAGVADGDLWYDTAGAKFKGRENGATVDLVNVGGGGGGLTHPEVMARVSLRV